MNFFYFVNKTYLVLGLTLVSSIFTVEASSVFAQEPSTLEAATPTSEETTATTEKPLDGLTFNDLRVPDSPAFQLMGISPTAISRPTNPEAFAISVLEASGNSESGFPGNLALEFAPYWWFNHPELTLDQYTSKTGFGQSIPQSLSFSVATSQDEVEADGEKVDRTRLGLGVRFNLLSGRTNSKFSQAVLDGEALARECALPTEAEILACLKKNEAAFQAKKESLIKEDLARVGFQLAAASAITIDSLDNSDGVDLSKIGAWLTPSYTTEKDSFTALGIGRYEYDGVGEKDDHIFDLGTQVIWKPESKISLGVEYLRRFGDQNDDRLVGIARYRIDKDYSFFASYGKAFNDDFTGEENLTAVFGINIGFGKGTGISIPGIGDPK